MENEEWSGIARPCQIVTERTIKEGSGTVVVVLVLVFANLIAILVTILLLLLLFHCYLKQYNLSLIVMLNSWLLFYFCC